MACTGYAGRVWRWWETGDRRAMDPKLVGLEVSYEIVSFARGFPHLLPPHQPQ